MCAAAKQRGQRARVQVIRVVPPQPHIVCALLALRTRNSLHTRLCFSSRPLLPPGGPSFMRCARNTAGPHRQGASRSSIRPTNRPTSISGLSPVRPKVSAQTHLPGDGALGGGRHLRRHWRPSGKLPGILRPSYSPFLPCCSPLTAPKPVIPFSSRRFLRPRVAEKKRKRENGRVVPCMHVLV